MVTLQCRKCGNKEESDNVQYGIVAKEICKGIYPELPLVSGKKTTYVRGMDGFKCPECGGVMFILFY